MSTKIFAMGTKVETRASAQCRQFWPWGTNVETQSGAQC